MKMCVNKTSCATHEKRILEQIQDGRCLMDFFSQVQLFKIRNKVLFRFNIILWEFGEKITTLLRYLYAQLKKIYNGNGKRR